MTHKDYAEIGARIRSALTSRGMTQEKLPSRKSNAAWQKLCRSTGGAAQGLAAE